VRHLANLLEWKNVLEGHVTLAQFKEASFYLPLQRIAIDLLVQALVWLFNLLEDLRNRSCTPGNHNLVIGKGSDFGPLVFILVASSRPLPRNSKIYLTRFRCFGMLQATQRSETMDYAQYKKLKEEIEAEYQKKKDALEMVAYVPKAKCANASGAEHSGSSTSDAVRRVIEVLPMILRPRYSTRLKDHSVKVFNALRLQTPFTGFAVVGT